jgi:hypothetical protein
VAPFSKHRGRWACALATVVALTCAPAASAALSLLPLLGGPSKPGPQPATTTLPQLTSSLVGGVASTLSNRIGLGTLGEMVTCPAGNKLPSITPAQLADAAAAARFLACELHVLDFEWRTTHPGRPNVLTGDRIVTTVGVPTPLNMDSDPLPDVLGTVLVLGPTTFQLSFQRINGQGALPGTAQLVLNDPTQGGLPASHIGIGIDSRGGRMPGYLSLTFTLAQGAPPLTPAGPPRFRVQLSSGQSLNVGLPFGGSINLSGGELQKEHVGVFADLFDESADTLTHDSFARAGVGVAPFPRTLDADIAMADDGGVDATVMTSDTTDLDADAVLNPKPGAGGARHSQRLHALLSGLPKTTRLTYSPIASTTPTPAATAEQRDAARGGQRIAYAASGSLRRLDVRYDDLVTPPGGGTPIPHMRANASIRDIPATLGLVQQGSVIDFQAPGGKLGRADAQFALDRDLITLIEDRPGVRFIHNKAPVAGGAEPLAVAARIDGVRSARIDTIGGRAIADVGIDRQAFDLDLRDDVFGISASATIADLPATAHVEYLPERTTPNADGPATPLRVRYDAGSDHIGAITFKAAFDKTISDYVDQIEGRITDLPPHVDVTAALEGKQYAFKSTAPFGGIEALARNSAAVAADTRPDALSDGATGVSAILRDGGPFAAFARILGLKAVTADLGANHYRVEAAPVPLEVKAHVDEVRGAGATREVLPRTLTAGVSRLPDSIDVRLDDDGAGHKELTYDASSRVDHISAEVTGPKLYAPQEKINKLRAGISDAPSHFTLRFGDDTSASFDAGTEEIGGIDALVSSGPDPTFTPGQHQIYAENGEELAGKIQLYGLKSFAFAPDPVDATLKTSRSLPLRADAKLDLDKDGTAESTADLTISNVPSETHARLTKDGKLTYDADAGVDSIVANAKGLPDFPQLPVKLRTAGVTVTGVPRHLDASYSDGGAMAFHAADGDGHPAAVGGLHVAAATEHPPALPDPGGLPNDIRFRQLGDELAGDVQIAGVRTIEVTPKPIDVVVDSDVLSALGVDAARDEDADGTDEKRIKATLTSDIRHVELHERPLAAGGKRFEVQAGSGQTDLVFDGAYDDLPAGIRTLSGRLVDLPPVARIDLPATGDKVAAKMGSYDAGGTFVPGGAGIGELAVSINGGVAPTAYTNDGGQVVHDVDGVLVHLTPTNDIDQAALTAHGLRGFSFGDTPHKRIGLDVNQAQAKALAFDVHAADGDKSATGFIDKLPENLVLNLSPSDDTPLTYSADTRISELSADTTFAKPDIKRVVARLHDLPKTFALCFRTDGHQASCMRSNRFSTATDGKLSAAFESDGDGTGARPHLTARACFDSASCLSGKIADLDVGVTKRLELEAGASAHGPTVRPFDCFDDTSIDTIVGDVGCAIAYPATALVDVLTTAGAHAFAWFDTGGEPLAGTAAFQTDSPGDPITAPIRLDMNLPTLTADGAYIEGNLDWQSIQDGNVFPRGGTLSCNGGSLTVSTALGWSGKQVDLGSTLVGFVNGVIDAYNALPGDDLAHIANPILVGATSVPLKADLVKSFCP